MGFFILMIVVDIETSGMDFQRCGIWQIGAYDLETRKEFLEEGRIDNNNEVLDEPGASKKVLEVIGKTEEELRDIEKQSQKQLLINFFKWCDVKNNNFICQNPQFDYGFLEFNARRYGLNFPVHHRCFDLHSIAQLKYAALHGNFLIKENHSDMGLTNILEFVGMKDNRKAHNALEDAKLTAECFSRLVYGRNLIEEYSQFKVPDYLKI